MFLKIGIFVLITVSMASFSGCSSEDDDASNNDSDSEESTDSEVLTDSTTEDGDSNPVSTDGSEGTWLDVNTDLTWREWLGGEFTWNDAVNYCESLASSKGKDWRLPSISELRTLISGCENSETGGLCKVEDDCSNAACNETTCAGCEESSDAVGCYLIDGLSKTQNGSCFVVWSGTEVSDDGTKAWGIDFGEASFFGGNKEAYAFVRCVQ